MQSVKLKENENMCIIRGKFICHYIEAIKRLRDMLSSSKYKADYKITYGLWCVTMCN